MRKKSGKDIKLHYKHYEYYKDKRPKWGQKDKYDEAPHFESFRKSRGSSRNIRVPYFRNIDRFVLRHVGQKWDDIYSKFVSTMRNEPTLYYLEIAIKNQIEMNPIFENGKVYSNLRPKEEVYYSSFYLDKDKVLRQYGRVISKKLSRRKIEEWPGNIHKFQVHGNEVIYKDKDIFYAVRTRQRVLKKDYDPSGERCRDLEPLPGGGPWSYEWPATYYSGGVQKRYDSAYWPTDRYPLKRTKRQLSSKEIKRLKLR